jgi:hypothetical protein
MAGREVTREREQPRRCSDWGEEQPRIFNKCRKEQQSNKHEQINYMSSYLTQAGQDTYINVILIQS